MLEVKGSLSNPGLIKKGDNVKIIFKIWSIQNQEKRDTEIQDIIKNKIEVF